MSPFIELEDNMNELYSPKMFMGVVQCWDNAVKIERINILNDEDNSEKQFKDCLLPSLIPKIVNKRPLFNVITTRTGKYVDINISHYPGYSSITNSDFRYCCEICPAVEQAKQFCIRRPESYQILCGDGGLGKTTLIFYLIHDVIMMGYTSFSKVIFLSAKKYFRYTDKNIADAQQEVSILPDIDNYQDFLNRLIIYFYDDKEDTENITEEKLINRINGKDDGVSIPNTFLVVDDLDTFVWEDQCRVVNFLKQINPKKMNALITTRNGKTNGYQIPLTLLDEDKALLFLRWCLDQEQIGAQSYMADNFDAHIFFKYTEGRPLDIKLWSNLMIRGLSAPQKFDIYWTKKQKTLYLYQTTLNQLNPTEQQLYRVLCEISECYEKIRFDMGVAVSLINYLYPNVDSGEIKKMLQVLEDVKLISMKNEKVFMSDIDYPELLNSSNVPELSEGLKNILKDIKAAPNRWTLYNYRERLLSYLAGYLYVSENSYEKSILRRMYEDRDNLDGTDLNVVNMLMQKYDLQLTDDLQLTEHKETVSAKPVGEEKPAVDPGFPDGSEVSADLKVSEISKASNVEEPEISDASQVLCILKKLDEDMSRVIGYINSGDYDESDMCDQIQDIYNRCYDLSKRISTAEEKKLFELINQKFLSNDLMDFL